MMHNARKVPLCSLRSTKILISLRICAGWSGPLLTTYRINKYCSVCRRTENVGITLHRCAGWMSGPSLFSQAKRPFSHVAHHIWTVQIQIKLLQSSLIRVYTVYNSLWRFEKLMHGNQNLDNTIWNNVFDHIYTQTYEVCGGIQFLLFCSSVCSFVHTFVCLFVCSSFHHVRGHRVIVLC